MKSYRRININMIANDQGLMDTPYHLSDNSVVPVWLRRYSIVMGMLSWVSFDN